MSQTEILQDDTPKFVSSATRANMILAGLGVMAVLTWHVALVIVSPGLGITDLRSTVHAALQGHPLSTGPHDHPSAVAALTVWGVLLLLTWGVCLFAWFKLLGIRRRKRSSKGMANAKDMAEMGEAHARSLASQTRPGLTARVAKTVSIHEIGWVIGMDASTRMPLVATPEDNVAIKGPPGSRKTSTLLAPAALDAPGALIVTTPKPDLLDIIYETCSKRGRVWVFDPLGLASWPEPMVWNPVRGCQRTMQAELRGESFADGLGGGADTSVRNSGFFTDMASAVLSYCLHAAALSGNDMNTVIRWAVEIVQDRASEAQEIIRASEDPRASEFFASLLESSVTGAEETVSSTRMQLTRMIRPLAAPEVMRWVAPSTDAAEFNAADFVRSTDTLVLMSDNQSPVKAGTLTTMLFAEVLEEAKRAARATPTGRLDPFLRIVGDEITNICPLRILPSFSATCRGYGIQLLIACQDDSQLDITWGADQADELLNCCTYELFLPGIKNVATTQRAADLVGPVDLVEMMGSYDEASHLTGQSMHVRTREVMRSDQVRRLADKKALAIVKNQPPVIIDLLPWYERNDAATITAGMKRTAARRVAEAARLDAEQRRIDEQFSIHPRKVNANG